jgi:regulator of nonsense transcripts 1
MSSRKSSKESTPAQPFLYYQTLIDENIESIQARIVHEKELEADHFQWLLGPDGVNSPRSVGISPAYSKSGGLPALACANDTRILVITFHSARAYRDGTDGSGTLPRNMKRRTLLEDQLLCNPLHTLYTFDLAPLALSLHLHLHLHLTEAVDIQSATKAPDRSIVAAVQVVIADASPIFSDIITSTFTRMLFESSKNKDLTDLVQRAWLCGYLGQYDFGTVKDMFANAPKVDMKKFSVDVRHLLYLID